MIGDVLSENSEIKLEVKKRNNNNPQPGGVGAVLVQAEPPGRGPEMTSGTFLSTPGVQVLVIWVNDSWRGLWHEDPTGGDSLSF